ncbi:MAG TPA: VOC family protein [Actinomycetota bacterium]|nr:VOC family protein [Actinomycetota bacterium]
MLDATVDHVAIAVRDLRSSMPFYTDVLGASFLFAGDNPSQGFRWCQFRFPGGGKFELVTPLGDGFVQRFLDRRGEGVHHVTLKVPDIVRALDHLEREGTPVFNVSIDDPEWREAFIHPKDAKGTLIQIVQAALSDDELVEHNARPHGEEGHRHYSYEELLEATSIFPAL